MIPVTLTECKELVLDTLKVGLVPMVTSHPGIGKSAMARAIADELGLELIDVRLSQSDPTDLCGFPQILDGKATYVPFDTFPVVGDSIPKGKRGWLLFLDEFNSASKATQAAAYKVTLDAMVGQHHLHPNCLRMCAGNMASSGAIVNAMSTAMQSRLVHFEVESEKDGWVAHAAASGFDHRVISYINWKESNLNNFAKDHDDVTFACERTWEFVSKLVSRFPGDIAISKLPLLAGTIGEGVAREFFGFCKIYQDLPTLAELIAQPTKIEVPTEPSTLFAMSGFIAENMKDINVEQLMKYVQRMPIEFQVIGLNTAIKKTPDLMEDDAIQDWLGNNATTLI